MGVVELFSFEENFEMEPIVSIIVPIYNSGVYLSKCLDSIAVQTFSNFECILIDDGSTDNSSVICDNYAANDSRFQVLHQKNKGAHAARLAGYKCSRGKYIGFVDADDWIEHDMYEKLVGAMSDGIDITMVCFTQECQGSLGLEIRKKWCRKAIDAREAIAHFLTRRVFGWELWCKLFRRELFDDNVFPVEISVGDDMISCLYLFQRAKKVVYMPDDSYHYRLHPNSMIHDKVNDVSWKFSEALRMALCNFTTLDNQVYNYILYLYSSILAKKIIDLYRSKNCKASTIHGTMMSGLRWSLARLDRGWLSRREKIFAQSFLRKDFCKFQYDEEKRNRNKILSFLSNNKRVYIYGAGKMGSILKRFLLGMGVEIEGFIVSKINGDRELDNIQIYCLNDILESLPNLYILIGVSVSYVAEIRSVLLKNGARHIYWPPILREGMFDNARIEKVRDKMLQNYFTG